jgi:Uma2 family endonuclease
MSDHVQIRVTAKEFFALPEERHPIQLIAGELIEMAPPKPTHQRIVARFYKLIDRLIPNGEVFFAPIAVYLDDDNVPEPDVVWVAEDSRCTIQNTRLDGPPDLVVEVLSPSTARYDKTVKFSLYERHGVREYWIVDPTTQAVEVWCLQNEIFVYQGVFLAKDTFDSASLGKKVELKTIFE